MEAPRGLLQRRVLEYLDQRGGRSRRPPASPVSTDLAELLQRLPLAREIALVKRRLKTAENWEEQLRWADLAWQLARLRRELLSDEERAAWNALVLPKST